MAKDLVKPAGVDESVWEEIVSASPVQARHLIREGRYSASTSGLCPGFAQANLIILPKEQAYDFLLFAQRNPKPCPILEVLEVGEKFTRTIANDCNIASDFPKYRIYENGVMTSEVTDISDTWQDDFVGFIIGCSFSFESELIDAGIEVRHNTLGRNVPMYKTNIECESAGEMHGNMVVSMRPLKGMDIIRAVQISGAIPKVHGAPVHIGNPELIGIKNIDHADFGDDPVIEPDETPVFWACGVTPQNVVMASKPPLAITHAPGCMLITDTRNVDLKF